MTCSSSMPLSILKRDKRQNRLSTEHIKKIVDTYQFRTEEKRYSRCVGMEEISENGYNLNISRYVSTTMPEKEIDLADVHKKMMAVDAQIKAATGKTQCVFERAGSTPLAIGKHTIFYKE